VIQPKTGEKRVFSANKSKGKAVRETRKKREKIGFVLKHLRSLRDLRINAFNLPFNKHIRGKNLNDNLPCLALSG